MSELAESFSAPDIRSTRAGFRPISPSTPLIFCSPTSAGRSGLISTSSWSLSNIGANLKSAW
jgi:hypothetical protein